MPTAVRTAHPSYSLFVLCTTFVVLVLPCTYAFGVTPQRSKQQAAAQAGSGLSAGLGRRKRRTFLTFSPATICWGYCTTNHLGGLCVSKRPRSPQPPRALGTTAHVPLRSAGLARIGTQISLYVALQHYYCAFAFGSGSAKCVEIT